MPQEFNFGQFEKVFDIVATQAGYYGIDKKTAKERAEKYLKKLGIWDKRDQQARMLSGGMKRRLMIARYAFQIFVKHQLEQQSYSMRVSCLFISL